MGNGMLVIHCMQYQLSKLSPVVDEEPTKTGAYGAQLDSLLDCYSSNDDYNDCSVGCILLSVLECLHRENIKLSSNHGLRC